MLIDPRDGWLLHVQCPCLGTTLLQASARWFREMVTFALHNGRRHWKILDHPLIQEELGRWRSLLPEDIGIAVSGDVDAPFSFLSGWLRCLPATANAVSSFNPLPSSRTAHGCRLLSSGLSGSWPGHSFGYGAVTVLVATPDLAQSHSVTKRKASTI